MCAESIFIDCKFSTSDVYQQPPSVLGYLSSVAVNKKVPDYKFFSATFDGQLNSSFHWFNRRLLPQKFHSVGHSYISKQVMTGILLQHFQKGLLIVFSSVFGYQTLYQAVFNIDRTCFWSEVFNVSWKLNLLFLTCWHFNGK